MNKLTSQLSKVRLVAPDEDDIAASPSLVRREPEARLIMSPSLNPLLLSFVLKFFTFQVRKQKQIGFILFIKRENKERLTGIVQ